MLPQMFWPTRDKNGSSSIVLDLALDDVWEQAVAESSANPNEGKKFRRITNSALARDNWVRSVVGASKVMSFVNPSIFPIWGSQD